MRRLAAGLSGQGSGARLARFLLIGLVNTALGYALFALFLLAGLGAQAALGLAFVLGVLWNFWAHARLVFGQGGLGRLPAYAAVYLAIWWANSRALEAAEAAGIAPLAAQAVLAPLAALAAFFLIGRVLTGRFPVFGRKR